MSANKTTGYEITEQTAPSRGSLASKFTRSLSLIRRWLWGEVMFWFRTLPFWCVCVSVLFWPKARKILAIAAVNTMIFFYCITRMLPKRKIKQNRGRTFKAAIKIKGDNDRS